MRNNKPTIHFLPEYFARPVHPIKVTLVGAGGNGSMMLSALGRIHCALMGLGGMGLDVTVYDPDTVEEPNIGRQLFTRGEIGLNKAECLVTRFNRCYGTAWKAQARRFTEKDARGNIIISCVDNIKTRKQIQKIFRSGNIKPSRKTKERPSNYREYYCFYWLDLGNGQRTGQAVLGSNYIPQPNSETYQGIACLPTVCEQFDLDKVDEKESGPSCSLAEALRKQDLFVNSALVQPAASLLWSVLTDAAIDARGLYVNLDNYRMTPITVTKKDSELIKPTK